MVRKERKPQQIDSDVVAQKDALFKQKQKENFDRRHGVRELPKISPGDFVWIKDRQSGGVVREQAAPRSYHVQTEDGEFRRNRRDLISMQPEEFPFADVDLDLNNPLKQAGETAVGPSIVQTRSGRVSKPPQRLEQTWN